MRPPPYRTVLVDVDGTLSDSNAAHAEAWTTALNEHGYAVSAGEEATAAAYVEVRDAEGVVRWGVGLDESILTASLKAVLCGVNRLGFTAS